MSCSVSAANVLGRAAIGVILTGMGRDGARGMAEMKQCGGYNLAQMKPVARVFGMPKELIAWRVNEVLPLDQYCCTFGRRGEKRTTWPSYYELTQTSGLGRLIRDLRPSDAR